MKPHIIISREQILKDWNEQFPLLTPYSSTSLMMKLDIFLVGVRIERSQWGGDEYTPHFICRALWDKYSNGSYRDLILQGLIDNKSKTNYSFDSLHYQYSFMDTILCAKKQFGFYFREKVMLSDFIRYLYFYNNIYRRGHPFLPEMVDVYRLQFALALYLNESQFIEMLKCRLEKDCKGWNNEQFYYIYNESINEWIEKQYVFLDHREEFLATIKENAAKPKLNQIKEGHIVNDIDISIRLLKQQDSIINRLLGGIIFHSI